MNLDLDDPLGDLLSDGSNDSFFEPTKKAKNTKPKDDPGKSMNKMESLFGIQTEAKELPKPKVIDPFSKIINEEQPVAPVSKKPSTPPKKSIDSNLNPRLSTPQKQDESKESLTSDFGFDPKKPKKKSNILDELLGIESGAPQKSNIFSKPSTRDPRDPSPPVKSISRQTTSETMSENVNTENTGATGAFATGYMPSSTRKSGRRQSAVVFSDPLGLFAGNESKEKEQIAKVSKVARKSIAGSEWLTGEVDKTVLTKMKSSPAIQVTPNSEERADSEIISNVPSIDTKTVLNPLMSLSKNPQLIETIATETSNTLQNLKQQEFQLMVASQMKNQENVLHEMKHKQQELLHQQEQQFNDLLKKQIMRQSELEDIIKQQQERINSHIQVLMSSQTNVPFLENYSIGKTADKHKENDEENSMDKIELEGEIKKLEMEKLRLEDLLSNITDNHEKEIVMIEQSYKKRIAILEENIKNIEVRYGNELQSLETFYQKKIDSLNFDKESSITSFESKLKMLEENQKTFIEKLKINYEADIETLRKHYEEMIENIRKSKLMEFAIKEESGSYMDVLKKAFSNLESASGDIQSLHEALQEKIFNLEKEREIHLNQRERKIEEQQKLLERTKENSEIERNKLFELIQTLEMKLNSIELKSEEEQWSLRQKLSTFEVEKKSFEKEREYFRNQQDLEQQRIQDLKQSQLNEYAKMLKEIENERSRLQEQKAELDISKQLQTKNVESGVSRAEIDAAVKFAGDSAKEAEKERERLIEIQRQYEAKKRELFDHESLLRSKQGELETAINKAKAKERAAEVLVKSTKKTEYMLMAKLQSLQKYSMELSQRESRIAKEKIELSQERVKLQSIKSKLYESRCSLCKIGDKANELKNIIQKNPKDFDGVNEENLLHKENKSIENFSSIADIEENEEFFNQEANIMPDIHIDLDDVPNLADMNDDLLDSDLLMLKFSVMNSKNF